MLYLIAARGLVGVDSAIYVQQFDAIRYGGLFAAGFEPGFSLLIYLLTFIYPDSFEILILLGVTAALILLVSAFWLEREPVLFLTLVVPFFLFDMTMNGLRYGLAFAVITLGTAAWSKGWRWLFLICLVIAATLQISSVALAAGTWMLAEARIKTFAAIGAIGISVLALFGDYLGDKAAQNADLVTLGGFSGVLPLVITLVCLVAVASDKNVWRDFRLPIVGLGLLQLASFAVSRYYYAGLRLQSLVVFMTYLVLALLLNQKGYRLLGNKLALAGLFVVMVLSSGLRLKNFSDEEGFGVSPFAPYYFARELAA
jgi:hypothetical protein